MLCLQSVFCGSTSWVADYRFARSDQDTTDYSDLQSTDFTDDTALPITDYTDMQIQDYGRTDGGAVKCDVMDALLAKQTTRLYFTDYRWRCHEV